MSIPIFSQLLSEGGSSNHGWTRINTDKAQIRVYPCPSVVKKKRASPSLTHYSRHNFLADTLVTLWQDGARRSGTQNVYLVFPE
jgi:hypothetical protein